MGPWLCKIEILQTPASTLLLDGIQSRGKASSLVLWEAEWPPLNQEGGRRRTGGWEGVGRVIQVLHGAQLPTFLPAGLAASFPEPPGPTHSLATNIEGLSTRPAPAAAFGGHGRGTFLSERK